MCIRDRGKMGKGGDAPSPSQYTNIIIINEGSAKDVLKLGKRQRSPPCHNKVEVWCPSVACRPTWSQAGTAPDRMSPPSGRPTTAGTPPPPRERPAKTEMKSGREERRMRASPQTDEICDDVGIYTRR